MVPPPSLSSRQTGVAPNASGATPCSMWRPACIARWRPGVTQHDELALLGLAALV